MEEWKVGRLVKRAPCSKSLPFRSPVRHWVLAGLWAMILGLIWPVVVWAHPLGNFTINRYSRLKLEGEKLQLHYIVDVAEVPALAEQERIDRDGNGHLSESERKEYLGKQVIALHRNLRLVVNGQPLLLTPYAAQLDFPPGQGGLLTVRLVIDFIADLPASVVGWQAEYQDDNYPNRRLGWQEIIVQADPAVRLLESTAPAEDVSQELRVYPPDLLQRPLQVRQASFRFKSTADDQPASREAGSGQPEALPTPQVGKPVLQQSSEQTPQQDSGQVSAVEANVTAGDTASGLQAILQPEASSPLPVNRQALASGDAFADLITRPTLGPGAIALALLAAFGWGAAHAFSPGHGKTVVAAYLVGSRGTVRHAMFLGLITTLTHTAGVFALGLITLLMSRFILPEHLYPWLGVASGLLVVAIGLSLFSGRLRHHHDHSHDHSHLPGDSHEHHHHDHPHVHFHDHDHSHLPTGADGAAVTWRNLLALGISGGLLPCPSALIAMLGAIALDRIGFGLVLIVAFSLGLAGMLTLTGLLFVYAGRLFNHLPVSRPFVRVLPLISALVVIILGIGIILQALAQTGEAGIRN